MIELVYDKCIHLDSRCSLGTVPNSMAILRFQEKTMRVFNVLDWILFGMIVAYLTVLIMVIIYSAIDRRR